ncbi:hypothetical protein [Arenimonas daejeonensis]|uniref:hypothetical protein n=1 Tax=Arenimonas daejeonensis TaxID=370777 RepID=UPI0011BE538B|nr:hypothetical protein [Arenimonas daejeonensis]
MLDAIGEVGQAVVDALLAAHHPVIAVAPERAQLEALTRPAGNGPELVRVPGNTRTETAGAALANAVRLLRRPPGAVVAMVGGEFTPGRLLDQPVERLRETFDEDLFPHLVAARHLLPLLAETGGPGPYLLIGGPAAESPGPDMATCRCRRRRCACWRAPCAKKPATVRCVCSSWPYARRCA